jgi:FMN phosphatase YigB (HAD superfamily)
MSLRPEQSPRWDEIDTVLLDLDGTLLDLAFDNYIWLARVAEIYAENHGLSTSSASTVTKRTEWRGCRGRDGFSSRFASGASGSC